MKKEFEKWFWRVVEHDFFESLEPWQQKRLLNFAYKAFKKGMKYKPN